MAEGTFEIDKEEYKTVFNVFDRDNSGEISISHVYELINKFDEAQKSADGSCDMIGSNAGNNNAHGGGPG